MKVGKRSLLILFLFFILIIEVNIILNRLRNLWFLTILLKEQFDGSFLIKLFIVHFGNLLGRTFFPIFINFFFVLLGIYLKLFFVGLLFVPLGTLFFEVVFFVQVPVLVFLDHLLLFFSQLSLLSPPPFDIFDSHIKNRFEPVENPSKS